MFKWFRARRGYQYSRWDGTQRLDDFNAESVLDALSDDYLRHGDLRQAMERLRQMGYSTRDGQRRMGMQDLLNRLRERRQQQMQRYDMSGVMDQIQEQLEQIKQLEREGIQRRLDESRLGDQSNTGSTRNSSENDTSESGSSAGDSESTGQSSEGGQRGEAGNAGKGAEQDDLRRMLENIANRKLAYLDQLPEDPAGQIRQLSEYDFMDEQARQAFQELLAMLQQQVMQQYFQGMQQTLSQMTPEDLARLRQMVRELNQMLREKAEGKEPDFDSFMQKYGDFFPGVNTLDDLIDQMQRQQMAMQAVMDSMSAEQRQQLHDMIDQLIGDDRLRVDLAELAMNLELTAPSE
ncbi:MAG: VWA domain-containing protein, partial [Ktedonobacterales bacterium]